MLLLNPKVQVVDQLAFGDGGRRLYAAGTQRGENPFRRNNLGIDVWEFPGQSEPSTRLLAKKVVNGFVVSPIGQWLYANADEYLRHPGAIGSGFFAISTATEQPTELELTKLPTSKPVMHPSGEWFIGCGCFDNWTKTRIVRWRQPDEGPPQQEWEWTSRSITERPFSMIYDHARSRVITSEGSHFNSRDPRNWSILDQFSLDEIGQGHLLLSPDGYWLINRSGPSFTVRPTDDLQRKPTKIRGGKLHFTGIAFHPSGQYLAATSNDTTVKFYDTNTWQLARTFTWNIGRLRSIAFSPDGMLAAVGSDTGRILVWDVDL